MEFVNADYNKVDPELSRLWTEELEASGFQFPARLTAGNFTILKPFDDGIFVVDQAYQVFHLKRVEGRPVVRKTPIDPALKCRHITVVESNLGQFHGLLLDGRNRLHLLTADNYKLLELDLPGYDPERMDFKIIFDPLYKTAVYSDERLIRAVALDRNYKPIASYEHLMSRAMPGLAQKIRDFIFPFRMSLTTENSRMIKPEIRFSPYGPVSALTMGLFSLAAWLAWVRLRSRRRPRPLSLAFVFITGIYGLIAGLMMLDD